MRRKDLKKVSFSEGKAAILLGCSCPQASPYPQAAASVCQATTCPMLGVGGLPRRRLRLKIVQRLMVHCHGMNRWQMQHKQSR